MSVCAVKLPDPQISAIGNDGEEAAAWGARRPFENLVIVVVAIIDVSMRGSANRRALFLDGVDSYSVSKIFFVLRKVNMHEAIGLSESLV